MSSAVHLNRAKEQIACKVFIQCIKHTAAQSKLSVPLQLVEKLQPSLAFLRLYDKVVLGDERCWNAEKWIVVS